MRASSTSLRYSTVAHNIQKWEIVGLGPATQYFEWVELEWVV